MVDRCNCAVCGKSYAAEADYLTETRRWRVCASEHLWFNCRCGSTLLIKKDKYPWYSPALAMSEHARSVFNRLGNLKDLPHLPSIVMELQQLLADPNVDPRRLAVELRRDPLLSSQVLKCAERLRCTRNHDNPPIRSLEHAIVYIGVRALTDMLMALAMRSFIVPKSEFEVDAFWSRAYLTGAIAEHLMLTYNPRLNADEVYVAASLCNIGKLVIACCFPPLATKISREIKNPKVLPTWRTVETTFQFPGHVILGEIAASLWGLPEYVMEAVMRHHDPISSRAQTPLRSHEITAAANQITHLVETQPHLVEKNILESFQERVDMNEAAMAQLVADMMRLKRQFVGI